MTEKDTDCYKIINMFPDSDAVLCFNQSVPLNDPLFFPAASSAGFFCVCFALLLLRMSRSLATCLSCCGRINPSAEGAASLCTR